MLKDPRKVYCNEWMKDLCENGGVSKNFKIFIHMKSESRLTGLRRGFNRFPVDWFDQYRIECDLRVCFNFPSNRILLFLIPLQTGTRTTVLYSHRGAYSVPAQFVPTDRIHAQANHFGDFRFVSFLVHQLLTIILPAIFVDFVKSTSWTRGVHFLLDIIRDGVITVIRLLSFILQLVWS